MRRDETRGEIDLSLPIEGFEQSETDVLGTGGQVIDGAPLSSAAASACVARSGRLASAARRRRGAYPSQSAATRRAPWNKAR